MKRIIYAEAIVGTDARLAELVLQYATELARLGSADTVTLPARIGSGPVQDVSLLLGPASQITVTEDDEPFGQDATAAIQDLERRIEGLTAAIPPVGVPEPPVLDELEALMPRGVDDS